MVFVVTGDKGPGPREIHLEARVDKLVKFSLYKKRTLIIEGELRHGGDIIILSDVLRGEWEHVFWAYGYAFSPSGRFLAYRSHYPRLGTLRKSIVLAYDLEKSPEGNMENIVPDKRFRRSIGTPIFPEENAFSRSLILDAEHPDVFVSKFTWSADDRLVAFMHVRRDDAGKHLGRMGVVVVEPFPEHGHPVIWRREINFKDHLLPGAPGSSLGGSGNGWAGIDTLHWEGHSLIATPDTVHAGELPTQIPLGIIGPVPSAMEQ